MNFGFRKSRVQRLPSHNVSSSEGMPPAWEVLVVGVTMDTVQRDSAQVRRGCRYGLAHRLASVALAAVASEPLHLASPRRDEDMAANEET